MGCMLVRSLFLLEVIDFDLYVRVWYRTRKVTHP